jgi:DNA-directed RNA polymerase subunit delta
VRILGVHQYSQEEINEMSLIEIAYELLVEKNHAVSFNDIMDEVSSLSGLTDQQVKAKIAQFYTELNIDGRFLAIGENQWGLRVWYPVDQVVEEIVNPAKAKKKKKAKKVVEEELAFDDPEEIIDDLDILDEDLDEDDDDDLEDIDLLDDLDDDLDDDDDLIDDDLEVELEIDDDDDDLDEDLDLEDEEDKEE